MDLQSHGRDKVNLLLEDSQEKIPAIFWWNLNLWSQTLKMNILPQDHQADAFNSMNQRY